MQNITPTLLTDGYKIDHRRQYPKETKLVYANMTPRKSRMEGVNSIVVFGIQYYVLSFLIDYWNTYFFKADITQITDEFMEEMTEYTLSEVSAKDIGIEHWRALHKLGYLPLEIKAIPEGMSIPIKVPPYTVVSTHDDFLWLTNFIETDMSSETWGTMTTATIANEYAKIFTHWSLKTTGNTDFVKFQGHNFSYRGCFGREAAALIDMAHATSFYGSDTLHGRKYLKKYYGAKQTGFNDIITCSVFATEHAVMCVSTGFYIKKDNLSWEKYGEAEFNVFKRLITELYPTGIVSIVSDTYNLWFVIADYCKRLKDIILSRDGKVVFRPDSSPKTPVEIMIGDVDGMTYGYTEEEGKCAVKGLVQSLWDIFGGTEIKGNDGNMYKILDSHVGTIYGDSITPARAWDICEGLSKKGFASINWVAGIGSYTYQYVTRDTFGFAQKATYAEVDINGERHGIEIFKDPITDDGTKKSKKGLLCVTHDDNNEIVCYDQCTWEQEKKGLLRTVFKDSKAYNLTNLQTIRKKLNDEVMAAIKNPSFYQPALTTQKQ